MDALLARLRDAESILWLLHVNADPDCVGSAFALREAFGGVVGATQGTSKAGGRLARRLGLDIDPMPHPEDHALVVAVDTSSRSQLGALGARAGDVCIVDHHRYGDLQARAPAAAWDPARPSCAEVALALVERAGKAPSATAALGLLAGIVTDTKRFALADAACLRDAARLLGMAGARMEEVIAAVEGDDEDPDVDDPSLRKATLVAASRVKVEQLGPFLVATSEVGSHDAAAALALLRCGADLAVVASERQATARMSLRASRRAMERGLHLGEIANEAARAVGWSGGGHEGAAGLSGAPPVAPARDAVLRLARLRLAGG